MTERLNGVIVIAIAVGHPRDQDQDQDQDQGALQLGRTLPLPSRMGTVGVNHAGIAARWAISTTFALIRRALSATRRDTTPPIALT